MIYPQLLLDLHDELIVDLFAGGGGASCGIEWALGRQPDIAVNHNPAAVAMHRANHPQTRHHTSDVFEVCPHEITQGRPVGLLWASPDCTYHSKARGSKPIRSDEKRRRALAWIVTRWAAQVRPRVIMLENVEEFAQWGPLRAKRKKGRVLRADKTTAPKGERTPAGDQELEPDPRQRGRTFRQWVRSLERLGYAVEWRELRACDYGAPTIRKRLFVVARCDGRPIVWPEPTHGNPKAKAVKRSRLQPYRTAAECIDWSIPMCSIFATKEEARAWAREHGQGIPKRPLAEATMKRIARGVVRYVLENPNPFLVHLTHHGARRVHPAGEPLPTVTGANRGELALVAPALVSTGYGERKGQKPRTLDLEAPLGTVVGSQKHALVAAFLAQNNAGFFNGAGRSPGEPLSTVTTSGSHQSLVSAGLVKLRGTSSVAGAGDPLHTISAQGQHHGLFAAHLMHNYTSNTRGGQGDLNRPVKTITTGGHAALVAAFLMKYYGTALGQHLAEPMHTIPTNDRFGLVTVTIAGEPFVIVDIALRMLWPRELYNGNGFPKTYIIDYGINESGGKVEFTKTQQVEMCGNAVPPQFARALARTNVPELVIRKEAAAA